MLGGGGAALWLGSGSPRGHVEYLCPIMHWEPMPVAVSLFHTEVLAIEQWYAFVDVDAFKCSGDITGFECYTIYIRQYLSTNNFICICQIFFKFVNTFGQTSLK